MKLFEFTIAVHVDDTYTEEQLSDFCDAIHDHVEKAGRDANNALVLLLQSLDINGQVVHY